MIQNPKALIQIQMHDWDSRLLGVLRIPRSLTGDARVLMDMFTQANFVHPDLRTRGDPWELERRKKKTQAQRDYPRRQLYVVETIIPAITEAGEIYHAEDGALQILHHSVEFLPAEYVPTARKHQGFHPMKRQEG